MASTPFNRVRYLLGLTNTPQTTPSTLSGGPEAIYSYRLCIAKKDGNDWLVYNEKNSPTTNRHLSAVRSVIQSNAPMWDQNGKNVITWFERDQDGNEWMRVRSIYDDRSTELRLAAD